MQRPDEAQIMAYVDGELDTAAVAEVERAVAADPALSRQVRDIMDTNALLRAAFNAPMLEPVPERLLAPLGAQRPSPWRRPMARRVMASSLSVSVSVSISSLGTVERAGASSSLPALSSLSIIARRNVSPDLCSVPSRS